MDGEGGRERERFIAQGIFKYQARLNHKSFEANNCPNQRLVHLPSLGRCNGLTRPDTIHQSERRL